MITKNKLHLASSSSSRKSLLERAQIPFITIPQESAEDYDTALTDINDVVKAIAQCKMKHAILPQGTEGEITFVLTADTMTCDKNGVIRGKPQNYDDAVAIIKALHDAAIVATGFCLEKKQYTNGEWHTIKQLCESVTATCICDVPDNWVDAYIKNSNALNVAGALMVDDFGSLFVKTINGSYTTILGLPMYELRIALEQCGFFDI